MSREQNRVRRGILFVGGRAKELGETAEEGMSNQEEALASGIFRGEGSVGCTLHRETKYGRLPRLFASVTMCDRDSAHVVGIAFHIWPTHAGGNCAAGDKAWQVKILGRAVIEKVGGWVASGLLRGEKADQYFEALAKFRRARRVFTVEKQTPVGRPRLALKE